MVVVVVGFGFDPDDDDDPDDDPGDVVTGGKMVIGRQQRLVLKYKTKHKRILFLMTVSVINNN